MILTSALSRKSMALLVAQQFFSDNLYLYHSTNYPTNLMKKLLLACILLSANVAFSQTQYAVTFDGVDDYINVPSTTALGLSTNFTIETWILPTGPGSQGTQGGMIMNKESSYEIARYPDGSIQFALSANGTGSDWAWVNTGLIAPLNVWSHIALVKTGTTVRAYLNTSATSNHTGQPNTLAPNASDLRIGNRTSSPHFFNGRIDHVRIWNIARTQDEIKNSAFGKDITPTSTGLVANFRMDAGSGTTAANTATTYAGITGTLIGGAGWAASPVRFAGNAIALDGTDDYVASNHDISNLGPFTLEGWVNLRSYTANVGFFGQNDALEFGLSGVNTLTGWTAAGFSLSWNFTSTDIPLNTWHHYAFVGTGSALRLVVDGVERATVAAVASNYGTSTDRFRMGGQVWNATGGHLAGALDEIRVWNVARTNAQVLAGMNNELPTASTSNLLVYYRFNGGIATGDNSNLTVIPDMKGNQNATATNMLFTSGSTSNLVSQPPALVILPVHLISFTAEQQQGVVMLNWLTAQETGSRDFIVQHSVNGADWTAIGSLPAAGNSEIQNGYHTRHETPASGVNYYRLLQRDIDGRESYSVIRTVRFTAISSGFMVLSNPVINDIELFIRQAGVIRITNQSGQVLRTQTVLPGRLSINKSALTPGTYFISMGGQTEKLLLR
ncbi:MAG: LamG domain-containing protein [Chitinophagaceae bacterium]|nr:MAG: LamG domain-containing protein [Chitinophagaceae bacterium]